MPAHIICLCLFVLASATARVAAAETVTITEFLAHNTSGLKDEDGAFSDWIEIFNSGATTTNLDGWFLTDSAANLTKWRFPATNIPPSGFLIVFASSKNRAVPGAPLHANFSLNTSGEYLALVKPDGVSIATEFAPAFPAQFENISYGLGQNLQITRMVSNTSPASVFVPTNGTLGTSWVATAFNDSAWRAGTNGVGYESYVPGFAIKNIRANVGVCDLGTADGVLANSAQQAAVFTETRNVVNYVNTGGGANFAADFTFPGFTINVDENNFVTEATGILTIPTAGNWTFGVNSDDGFRVTIGANVLSYPSPRGPGDSYATFNLAAGDYPVRLVFYECGGGAEVEFFAASGSYTAFNSSFRLVGDSANGGLAVKSLPVAGGGGTSYRSLITTYVQTNMAGRASSAYIRIPFNIADPGLFSTLTLRMKYDDGFVAYLNGAEIARRNAPATPLWNSLATASRQNTNAVVFEDIDVTTQLSLLQAGNNLLAIHGLNDATNSPDFLIAAELVENKVLGLTNHYFSTPSPGAVNGSGFFAFVDNLKFSPGRGWFSSTNFSVTITSATPGITIRYTTNGSPPSPTNGLVYIAGIPISGTTILRAIGFRDGFEPTEPETHSYIFLDQVQQQTTNVNYVGGSSGNYTLDPNVTQNSLYQAAFQSNLVSIPTLSIVLTWEDVFGPSGVWSNPDANGITAERPCSLEYMRPDGQKGFNVNCGIRIQGGASRDLVLKHGLRVLFKTIYGPSKLAYDLYPDSPVKEFDTLTLHATFNDHWLWAGAAATMQRDQWCRDTQNAMGGYGPHGTYVHLYLNGLYWGLYDIGEKGDASYAAHYLGGDPEEYDAFNSDELVDGDTTAWNTMFGIANAGITNDVTYTNLTQYLDIPNFIDYMIMNFYGANGDWPWHNWNAARRRVPGATFHFFSWDAEWTFGIGNGLTADLTGTSSGSPGILYSKLRAHLEFNREFGDHVQKHLFNGGALTPASAEARWSTRQAEIDGATIPESARWGAGYTHQTWLTAEAAVHAWFPQRTTILLGQFRAAGLYPQLNPPDFSQLGGLAPPGYALRLTNSNGSGTIYFTLDGSDPRLWGGALAPTAQVYSAPLTLTNALFIRARIRSGTNWSAIVGASFYIVQDFAHLAVTEIMYHPPNFGATNGDELEFLELKNTGTNALDLSGLQFTDGITFSFTNGTRLAPGTFFVLARNPAAFATRYPGVTVNGVFSGKLDNSGEKLTLTHVLGTNAFSFSYATVPPWPLTPDGYGFSLVRAESGGDPSLPASWRPSANSGGSPGADDPPSNLPPIVINEILTHTTPPQSDAIELFNPTPNPVNIGGWFLSDDGSQPMKFRIPNSTILAPNGFAVLGETNFNSTPGVPPSFSLSSLGESLYLFSGDAAATNLTGYSHSFEFGTAANGVSFGRYLISSGEEDWPAQTALTLGGINSGPRVGPVVINEIMYHPPAGFDEFVELSNLSASPVPLYDPAYPTNGWRLTGLSYSFSNNITLAPNAFLLVVPIDPALFRAKYGVASAVQILGPCSGLLQDSGERLRLERPDAPVVGTNGDVTVPYIVVDEVRYNDKLPWPLSSDGDGPSLQRRLPSAYGNEPTNWFASGITPGGDNIFNLSPTISIFSPTNGAVFAAPASFTLSGQASDPDGIIALVELFRDGLKLGETTNNSYSFSVNNLPFGTYMFTAKARDNSLATTSASITVRVTPPPLGTGTGLNAEYYDNMDFTGLKLARTDPIVNFNWGSGSPDASMGADQFSVRWTGLVQPRLSETYTFHTLSDDGIRLWVNNVLLINNWTDHSPTEDVGSINLVAGTRYDIRLEFYENGGGAQASLSWSAPDLPVEIIPQTQLYTTHELAILSQPTNAVVRAGSSATFGVTAAGTAPLNYQWLFNGTNLPGATATNLVVTNAQVANVGGYRVIVANGQGSITSSIATLALVQPVVILRPPQSQTALAGDTVIMSVEVGGTPPFGYSWRKDGRIIVPFGVGASTLILTNVQPTNSGNYAVGVTNAVLPAQLSAAGTLTVLADSDGDHMPDKWETDHGLNPNVNDANLDPDGDGMTNLQEYIAGTDPQDPLSYLKVDQISAATTNSLIRFTAVSNRTYSVLYRAAINTGPWVKFTNLDQRLTNRIETVIDHPPAGARRFYRLATPALP